MKAVNLIPRESRRGGAPGGELARPRHAVLGAAGRRPRARDHVRARATTRSRSARRSSRASRPQVRQAQAPAAHLASYAQFAQLAQARAQTVRQIAATRFDWQAALGRPLPGRARRHLAAVADRPPSPRRRRRPAGLRGAASGSCAARRHRRARVRAERLHEDPGRRRPADVAAAAHQRRHPCDAQRLAEAGSDPAARAAAAGTERPRPAAATTPRPSTWSCSSRRSRAPHRPPAGAEPTPRHDRRADDHATPTHHAPRPRRPRATTPRPDEPCDRTVVLMVAVVARSPRPGSCDPAQARPGGQARLPARPPPRRSSAPLRAQLAQGQAAKSAFAHSYASIARLGEAVPADDNVPSLIYQIQSAASSSRVDFLARCSCRAAPGGAARPPRRTTAATAPLPPGVDASARPASRPSRSRSPSRATSSTSRASSGACSGSSSPPTRRSRSAAG